MWRAGLSALLSHWRRRPMQLAMLLLGLSIATALWTGVQAINAEARASYAEATDAVAGNALEQLVSRDGSAIPLEAFVALRRAGWLVSPVLEGETRFGPAEIRIVGIEPLTLPRDAQQVELGVDESLSSFLTAPGEMHVNEATARRLRGQVTPPLRIAGDLPDDVAIVDIGVAQDLLDAPGQITRLVVDPGQPHGRLPLDDIAPELERRAPEGAGDLARLTDSFHLNLTAFGLLAFVVGLFIVYSAIGLAFEQRRPMFRTLRALGIPARTLTLLLLAELLILALTAGLAGVVLGYGIAVLLLPDVAATLRGLYGAGVDDALALRPEWWLAGLGIAVAGTLVASAQSLWRLSRLPVLAPAQPRAWARASEAGIRIQMLAAVFLFAAALAIHWLGSGLVAGFAILGALLLGAALILPVLLSAVLSFCQGLARGPLAQWFWADTRQQLPGLSLSLMALLLALATNIGVGAMVSSFRLTFVGYLDQRLASELYVQARTTEEAAEIQAWLRPRVDAVLPMVSAPQKLLGQPGEILGFADHSTYRDHWPLLHATPGAWDSVARGQGVLINEQLFRRAGLRLGDTVTLADEWAPVVVGVYSDYGNPTGQVIGGLAEVERRYSGASRLQFGVRVDPERISMIADDMQRTFGLPSTNLADQARIKDMSLQIFERTFAVTAALNVLTLGVASLAMFASMMTLSGMRLPQLAPVWAMGLTRRRLATLELLRTLALALLTMIASIPVGVALAWVLLAVVNVEAFGWRLPMYLFPGDWLRLAVLAVMAALIAALIPVRRLAKLAPSDLLRVFSHER